MASVSFPYEEWDITKDVLLENPGTPVGLAAIKSELKLGLPVVMTKQTESRAVREAEEGVIQLVAGGLEWLRWRGLTKEEVQNRVRAFKISGTGSAHQRALRAAQESQDKIADIDNIAFRLDPNKIKVRV